LIRKGISKVVFSTVLNPSIQMQIDRIFYPIKTLGFGSRIGIWTVGCVHNCYNCSNPELWDPAPKKNIPLDRIIRILTSIHAEHPSLDGVTISGGEPFLQSADLAELITFIKEKITHDILLYSGFTIDELEMMGSAVQRVLRNIAALVDGRYEDSLNDNRPLRGSSNQRVLVFDKKYAKRYMELQQGERLVQNVFNASRAISFGIPIKDYRDMLSSGLIKKGVIVGE
jgi:anaerobic ribonucleoside-triphosphate reductase activating protein